MLTVERTAIPEVMILTPKRFDDNRGFFVESWNRARLSEHGIDVDFVQDNTSFSISANTIRGLHYQRPPHAQDKLVRCSRGALFDVAVDIRKGSPTYGEWVGVELSFENRRQLLIPKGFLHGFITREPDTEIAYKCSAVYASECDAGIRWDDPDIAIDWGVSDRPVLSGRDAAAPFFRDLKSPFIYDGAMIAKGTSA